MIKRPIVSHFVPTDMLLNTARMRDAVHMEPLRFPIDPANVGLDDAILQGSSLEVKVRKAVVVNDQVEREKAEKAAAKAKEKADVKEKADELRVAKAQEKADNKEKAIKVRVDKAAAKAQEKLDKAEAKEKDKADRLRLKDLELVEKEAIKLARLDARAKKSMDEAAKAKARANKIGQGSKRT